MLRRIARHCHSCGRQQLGMIDSQRSCDATLNIKRTIVFSCRLSSSVWVTLILLASTIEGESFANIRNKNPQHKHINNHRHLNSQSGPITTMTATSMKDSTKQDTEEFLKYAAAAVDLSSVHFIPKSDGILSVIRSVRDLDKKGRQKYLYHIPLDGDRSSSYLLPPTLMESTIQIRLPSPSGTKLMIVKQDSKTSSDKDTTTTIEIWQGDALTRRIVISEKRHGPIINDGTGFGIPTWSPDETCILYAAERKPVPTKPYWDSSSRSDNAGKKDDKDSTVIGGQNILGQGTSEDWGEKLSHQSPIMDLYILNAETGKYNRVANVPNHPTASNDDDGITLGQPVWHPSGNEIAYTGWDAGGLGNMSRRLGMIFCRNRPSRIYVSDVSKLLKTLRNSDNDADQGDSKEDIDDKEFICITPDYVLSRSPQYIDIGNGDEIDDASLVFLSNPKGFVSHDGCMGLYEYKNTGGSAAIDCIVPVIQDPSRDGPLFHGMGFPGLFLSQLPIDFQCGQQFVIINTVWGSFQKVIRVDIHSGAVNLIEIEGLSSATSQSILCKSSEDGDSWIISEVASNQPAKIWNVHGLLGPADDGGIVHAKNVDLAFEFSSIATTAFSSVTATKPDIPIDLKVISISPPDVDDKGTTGTNIQALVMLPRKAEKVPLVVFPHGGPHSCTVSNYAPGFTYLASHYAVVFPNYRGSTGFGQATMEYLMTRIGQVDVQDVMACTNHVIEQEKDRIDSSRIGICGGSHGGFLTAHCTGQYPDFFKAAVMRNPVTNIASMVTATDIADWCYAEALGAYDTSKFRGPTLEEMTTMYERSPIVNAGNVQTPTLVALGMVDLRVPPSQGKEWYHTLRSAGIDTQLLVYPEDSHALDKVTTEADHWINIKRWFDKYFIQ